MFSFFALNTLCFPSHYSHYPHAQIARYVRALSVVTVQCMLVNAIPDQEWEATFQGLIRELDETPSSLVR